MYKAMRFKPTSLNVNESKEGQTLETKIERLLENGEDIGETGVDKIYTERKDGVQPAYNIRADKMELALEALDKSTADQRARRMERYLPEPDKEEGKDGGTEPTQGTE